jgi:hypothetical protein
MLAANRDEMRDRPWSAPGRHWRDRPDVFAGLDRLAGGSWLGINDHGLVAAILNRRHSLGPAPGLRSRGELVLEALDHADAKDAAAALADLDSHAYRSFNLVVADQDGGFWIKSGGPGGPRHPLSAALPDGLSMITAEDLNDMADPRIARHLPRFRAAEPPDPGRGDWTRWQELLASRDADPEGRGAMSFRLASGFGTVSSALIAIPDARRPPAMRPVFRFADGHPDAIVWRDLSPARAGVATLPTRTL